MKNLQEQYNRVDTVSEMLREESADSNSKNNKCRFCVDSRLVVTSWDANMEKLTHKMADEAIGQKIEKVFPFLHDDVALAMSVGKKRRLKKFKNICFMGTNLSSEINILPVKDRDGMVHEVAVVIEKVEGKCPLDKKLTESEKMVAIGKIASTLAHGVRNPLNAIKGAVVYLKEKYGHEATLREFSSIIDEEIEKLDKFISNFLSASKGELVFVPVNINGLIKQIISMIKPRSDIQNIRINYKLSVLPLIMADAFQLEQALFNIINNAIEAMSEGGSIDIKSSMSREADVDYALVEISDTGKGIPETRVNELGNIPDNMSSNGRGFGVFLSREVIKAHNGKLLWESQRGIGTTFRVFLPVDQGER